MQASQYYHHVPYIKHFACYGSIIIDTRFILTNDPTDSNDILLFKYFIIAIDFYDS
uniref:Uncharacterized protein n=1 Tax=Romanomermis culicivorax TaxID=13658 RepID=A0A915KEI9_ROMCU